MDVVTNVKIMGEKGNLCFRDAGRGGFKVMGMPLLYCSLTPPVPAVYLAHGYRSRCPLMLNKRFLITW
jgi:hypothetical protein